MNNIFVHSKIRKIREIFLLRNKPPLRCVSTISLSDVMFYIRAAVGPRDLVYVSHLSHDFVDTVSLCAVHVTMECFIYACLAKGTYCLLYNNIPYFGF